MSPLARDILEDILPLTAAQEGILFHHLSAPGSGVYFQQTVLRLTGRLDQAIFREAVNQLVQQQEGLRIVFRWQDLKKPVQVLLKQHELPLRFFDSGTNLPELLEEDAARGISIEEHPVRMMVVSHSVQEHTLVISFHHMALDGWSFGLLVKHLLRIYSDCLHGHTEAATITTHKVIRNYLQYIQNRDRQEEALFWKEQLAGFSAATHQPYQRQQTNSGVGRWSMQLDGGLMDSLQLYTKQHRVSVASIFYAAWAILLHNSTGEASITFGTTTAGRPTQVQGIGHTIGMFINTLPFHLVIDPQQTISAFLNQVNNTIPVLFEYGLASLSEIKTYAGLDTRETLFNTLCVIENYPLDLGQDTGLTVQSFETFEQTNYDITLSVLPFQPQGQLLFSYKKKNVDQDAIERMGQQLGFICACLIKEAGTQPLHALDQGGLINTSGRALNNNARPDSTTSATTHLPAKQEATWPVQEDDKVLNQVMAVCREVLQVQQVRPTDNFFRIRGDSIKAIRVLSLLRKAGYRVDMDDILEFPVLQELAMVISRANTRVQQEPEHGTMKVNAIQSNFFAVDHQHINWYNQAIVLTLQQPFPKGYLQPIVAALTEHHDVFRLRFRYVNGQVNCQYAETASTIEPADFDMAAAPDQAAALKTILDALHAGLHLQNGPLARFGLIRTNTGTLLAMVMHHLITDGVSWRILLDDLQQLLQQLQEGTALRLSNKSTSFGTYLATLHQEISKGAFDAEMPYWENILAQAYDLLWEEQQTSYTYKDLHRVVNRWEPALTQQVEHINLKLGTTANEVLIAALGMALQQLFPVQQLTIHLEGHGRTELAPGLDLSRTVGWFTALFPVHIDLRQAHQLLTYVRTVKEAIKTVPGNGEGFGVLQRLSGKFPAYRSPQVCFNYLGDFSASTDTSHFSASLDETGAWYARERNIQHPLEVFAFLNGDQTISCTVDFIPGLLPGEKVQELLQLVQAAITIIHEACADIVNRLPSPSDFTFPGIQLEVLDRLLTGPVTLKDIYELSPTQEALVHHYRKTGNRNDYVINANLLLKGRVDVDILEQAFDMLISRHDILRTTFRDDLEPGQTVQLVQTIHNASLDRRQLDATDPAHLQQIIQEVDATGRAAVQDIFSSTPNIRAALLQVTDNEYRLSFYYHHILADGWTAAVLLNELFTIYHLLQQHKDPALELEAAPPYQFYIKWLRKIDQAAAARYWKRYLQEFEEPFAFRTYNQPAVGREMALLTVYCAYPEGQPIQNLLQQSGCTLYHYLQTVWALLLSRLSGNNDILFGQVVSGRPPIAGADQMTGLFINTLPKRVQLEETMSLMELMKAVARDEAATAGFHYFPLADILRQTPHKENLFSHIIVFENQYQLLDMEGTGTDDTLRVVSFEGNDPNPYPVCIVFTEAGKALKIEWRFDKHQYDEGYMEQLLRDFQQLFQTAHTYQHTPIAQLLYDQSGKVDLPLLTTQHL
ncbi:hypothetical protein D3H65_06700 [Paraflavitalea soli]|uniref:Carrier domain-containing protein n=1 Tax=Paraflavitalea soli TaxID=2315862 RepID=A0A3B7MH20_9BACT|nr:condensation domain-containing protein [Paraflavitalea soli]AXY73684.1 hypothetical protein D3H65_06700 [Paraflavitalea soli]